MNDVAAALDTAALPPPPAMGGTTITLEDRVRRACARVAPVWPLADFVAVSPFHGLSEMPFGEAVAGLRDVTGRDALPARALLAEALATGRLSPADLSEAAREAGLPPEALAEATRRARPPAAPSPTAATVADVLDATLGTAWSRVATGEVSKWCAAWADEGGAAWPTPWRDLPLYAAWREAARHDRAPEAMGLRGFREAAVASLPADPVLAVAAVLHRLGLAPAEADAYLHRALLSVGGWAAYLRGRGFARELEGAAPDDAVLDLLAVRLAWDAALHAAHAGDAAYREAWDARLRAGAVPPSPDLPLDLALLDALERGPRRDLAARIASGASAAAAEDAPAPDVQAVFCIDVRSEVFRRELEVASDGGAATLGFAGFFGFGVEYARFGERAATAQLPVLLRPSAVVCEAVRGAAPGEADRAAERRGLRRRVGDLWHAFRASAVSCFAHVETAGLLSAADLARGALRRPRPADAEGLDPALLASLGPDVSPGTWRGRASGFSDAARLDAAEAVLRAMSLTEGFAGVVLLAGHAARTTNNPHAASLDCGACGGHGGEANARVAAAVLNDPLVRAGLAGRGIAVPPGTWFVAGLHDTTTDEVVLYDTAAVPPPRAAALARLQGWLAEAGRRARARRAPSLGLPADGSVDLLAATRARAADWSEVRPEWGLAGNHAFVAAPRRRTRGLDLGGRAFLHSYDWTRDEGFRTLELILTAPVVVAAWINLQYYGSSVDPEGMGSGDKTLHNVVGGGVGVLEGQGGDLRVGLPRQSVHDGRRLAHEPVRLSVFVEAPEAEIEAVLARHPEGIGTLVENGWLHLLSIGEEGRAVRRRLGAGRGWETVADRSVAEAAPREAVPA